MWYFLFWPKTYIGGEKILKLNKSNASWKCSEWLKVRTSTVAWWWSNLHLLTKTMKCGWKHQAGKWILSRKWLVNCCFQKNKSSRYSWRNNFKRTHFDLIWVIIWFCSINKAEKCACTLHVSFSKMLLTAQLVIYEQQPSDLRSRDTKMCLSKPWKIVLLSCGMPSFRPLTRDFCNDGKSWYYVQKCTN